MVPWVSTVGAAAGAAGAAASGPEDLPASVLSGAGCACVVCAAAGGVLELMFEIAMMFVPW